MNHNGTTTLTTHNVVILCAVSMVFNDSLSGTMRAGVYR